MRAFIEKWIAEPLVRALLGLGFAALPLLFCLGAGRIAQGLGYIGFEMSWSVVMQGGLVVLACIWIWSQANRQLPVTAHIWVFGIWSGVGGLSLIAWVLSWGAPAWQRVPWVPSMLLSYAFAGLVMRHIIKSGARHDS